MMRLTIVEGQNPGTIFELNEGENLAGRSRSANIHLEAGDVSGRHLMIVVKDGKAIAENLGRSGTVVNDAAVTAPIVLQAGEKLHLGAETVLLFEDDSAPAAPGPGRGLATGVAPAKTTPPPAPEATGMAPIKTGIAGIGGNQPEPTGIPRTIAHSASGEAPENDVPRTLAAIRADDSPEGGTRVMQTRIASQEEIEFLREAERKRARRKLTLSVVVGGAVLLLMLLLWPRRPPPEVTISWPQDEKGDYIDAFLPSPAQGGHKDGGFDLAFPGTPGWSSKVTEDGVVIIETIIGRDRNIPLRLTLEERIDPKEAEMTRHESLEAWIAQTKDSGGRWNFDPPSAVFFLGKGNGVPCVSASYHREGDAPWFGVATLFRHGICRVVLRAEVPAAERVRAEVIVSTLFFNMSQDFVNRHWEASDNLVKGETANLIRQARLELEHVSPAAWSQVEAMIVTALRNAVVAGNQEQANEAMRLLLRLRENQEVWFNAQRIAYFNAWAQGDPKQARRITEICKAIFSGSNDQRYYAIRKNQW